MDQETRTQIDEIKHQHPIQEVAARYLELRHSGDRLIGHCPFHDDRCPSFSIHLPTETWSCFAASCDLSGDVIDFVGQMHYGGTWNSRDKTMFKEALRQLEGDLPPLRRIIPETWRNPSAWRPVELSPQTQMLLHTAARLYYTSLIALDREPGTPYAYLREREFKDETIRREVIGYASGDLLGPALAACGFTRAAAAEANLLDSNRRDREFMAGRIVFMEFDRTGRVLHLIGRAFAPWISREAPKYLSLKELAKPLYGYARLDKRESDTPVLLVESPPDAITARQWGFDALANIGSKMKREHAVLLGRLRRPIVILPHNDEPKLNQKDELQIAGWAAAERWQELIGQGAIVPLPKSIKDLNDLGKVPDGEAEFVALMKRHGFVRKPKPGLSAVKRVYAL
jgi:DNA primase